MSERESVSIGSTCKVQYVNWSLAYKARLGISQYRVAPPIFAQEASRFVSVNRKIVGVAQPQEVSAIDYILAWAAIVA